MPLPPQVPARSRPRSTPGLLSTAHAREAGVIQGNKDEVVVAFAGHTEHYLDVGGILSLAGCAPEGLCLHIADWAHSTDLYALAELLAVDAWGDIAEEGGRVDGAVVVQVVLEPVILRADPGDGLAELPCVILRSESGDAGWVVSLYALIDARVR